MLNALAALAVLASMMLLGGLVLTGHKHRPLYFFVIYQMLFFVLPTLIEDATGYQGLEAPFLGFFGISFLVFLNYLARYYSRIAKESRELGEGND